MPDGARLHIDDDQRRARLAVRHALAPAARVASPAAASRAMTALHATENASVYLSVRARTRHVSIDDVHRSLHDERSLVKLLSMRSTLFAYEPDLLPAAYGAASARVAGPLRRTLATELEGADDGSGVRIGDGAAFLTEAKAAVVAYLADHPCATVTDIKAGLPMLSGKTSRSPGTKWGGEFSVAPRVLSLLGLEGDIVRATNAGHWRINKPSWALPEQWLGARIEPLEPAAGYEVLVRRYLQTFSPATEADMVWWLGATKTAVRTALATLGAVPVSLDSGLTGFLLPDDPALDGERVDADDWAALLPVLDPTSMGYRNRDWYLEHADVAYLVDSVGNIGTTAWWNGRVVGCWVQDDDGAVALSLRHSVPPAATRALDAEAERLTQWLGDVRIPYVYRSAQMKGARLS